MCGRPGKADVLKTRHPYAGQVSTPARRAYRAAWRVRQQTGDQSSALLLDKLRANGADPVWFEADGEAHKWLMGCWARGVSPRRLAVEAVKAVDALIPRIVKPIREGLKHFR